MTASLDKIAPPADGELILTSGFCQLCDSHFRDELAYRIPALGRPGHVLLEARHFSPAPLRGP